MKKRKINPSKRPATMKDVNRAKKDATDTAVISILVMVLNVLHDKNGFGTLRLNKVLADVDSLSDSLMQGRLSMSDLKTVLREKNVMFEKYHEVSNPKNNNNKEI